MAFANDEEKYQFMGVIEDIGASNVSKMSHGSKISRKASIGRANPNSFSVPYQSNNES